MLFRSETNTLGGVVSAAIGRMPVRGEIVVLKGFEFEILEADPRRVKRLRIRPRRETALGGGAG